MEFSRTSDTISKKEFNLLIRATEDRLFNLQQLGISGLTADGCLPESARCDVNGNSSLPGFREIMNRAIHQSIAKVENRVKLALYPRRKTNFAKTPREVYENRDKFSVGVHGLGVVVLVVVYLSTTIEVIFGCYTFSIS